MNKYILCILCGLLSTPSFASTDLQKLAAVTDDRDSKLSTFSLTLVQSEVTGIEFTTSTAPTDFKEIDIESTDGVCIFKAKWIL